MLRRHLPQIFAVLLLLAAATIAGYGVAAVVSSALASGRLARQPGVAQAPPERKTAVLGVEDSAGAEPLPTDAAPIVAAPAPPAETQTAEPTGTITAAPAPTSVPTPTADSPTASVPPAPLMAVQVISDTFDSVESGWIQRQSPTWSAAYRDGRYALTTTGQQAMNVASSLDSPNYRVTVDVSVERGSGGIVFLAAKPAVFYRFVISTEGSYAIQRQEGAQVTNVVDWTQSDTLQRPSGTTYRVRVERRGDRVQCIVNDEPLLIWNTPSGDTIGQYGLAVASRDGQSTAEFDNLIVERLEE